uniref:Uncharacterized protein n=1 Tax=Leersia perrieri TaxID=77586 RepID=A0A0D9X6C8_9ORYZ
MAWVGTSHSDMGQAHDRNHDSRSSHNSYLQAISKITASNLSIVSVIVEGKSATGDLSKLKPTEDHHTHWV